MFSSPNFNEPANSVSETVEGYELQPGSATPPSPTQSVPERLELYPDLNPDQRFLEPQKYFSELQSIEADVVERSALHLFNGDHEAYYHNLSPSIMNEDFHVQITDSRSETSHESLDELVRDVSGNLNIPKLWDMNPAFESSLYEYNARLEARYLLFHLLECRNLLARVARNLSLLHEKQFLTTTFSVLISSLTRPEVVELVEWNPKEVLQLALTFTSL